MIIKQETTPNLSSYPLSILKTRVSQVLKNKTGNKVFFIYAPRLVAIVYADHLEEALDQAADDELLNACGLSYEQAREWDREGWEYTRLGGSGECFDLTYMAIIEVTKGNNND